MERPIDASRELAEQVSNEIYDAIATGDPRNALLALIENTAGILASICYANEIRKEEMEEYIAEAANILARRTRKYIVEASSQN